MIHSTSDRTLPLKAVLPGFALALLGLHASAQERLESTITGNQEQPQVLYIVPWQTPDSPTLKYDVVQSQSAKVYEHLDRSELKREIAWQKPVDDPKELASNSAKHSAEPDLAEENTDGSQSNPKN